MSKWLNNKHIIQNNLKLDFPCEKLEYCPYGQLVEEFPLENRDISCPIFGHDCPVYYHAEFVDAVDNLLKDVEEARAEIAETLVVYTDGGCSHPNQKDQSIREMISVVATEDGDIVKDVSNHTGSNNLAELIAMEHALDFAIDKGFKRVHIITDSQIAMAQFKRDDSTLKDKVKNKMNNYEWYEAVKGRIEELKQQIDATIEWQPRETNLAGFYIEEVYGL